MQNNFSNIFVRLVASLGLVLVSGIAAIAQDALTKGVVKDAKTGEPLIGARVQIKGSDKGTVTGIDGSFNLPVEQGQTLVISSLGYTPREIKVAGESVTVSLQEDTKALNEVVVVGYGTQSQKAVSSAVTSVNPEELKGIPAPSPDQLLQGKASGVQISSASGTPGGGIFVRIRGNTSINASNEPLYVVDGVFINNQSLSGLSLGGQTTNPLADLNPADIESIEILKDANATAIYGARGANGVVLITTKRGKTNAGTRINFQTYAGIAKAPKIYETVNAQQEAELINETYRNDGGNPALVPFRPKSEGGLGLPSEQTTYSRIPDVFRTALTQSYDLSASGGGESNRFFLGGGYFKQEGIVKPAAFERFSGRFNYDHLVNNRLTIGTSTTVSYSKRNQSRNDDSAQGVINSALYVPTYLPVFNEDGSYARHSIFDNHLALINNLNIKGESSRLISNLYGEYEVLDGLTFKSSWSLDYNNYSDKVYNNTQISVGLPAGNTSRVDTRLVTLLNEQLLTYNKRFGNDHFLNVLLGNTVQQTRYNTLSLSGRNFPSDNFQEIASSSLQTGSTNSSQNGLISFFSRAGYTFKDRYSVDGSMRADASSRFGAANRWGVFPSLGASWIVSEEAFAQDLPFDLIKLRANIGLTGNQNGINDFASLGLWRAGRNYDGLPGISHQQLANPDLKWETTRQWNVGLDLGLLQNRLKLEANYYNKYTKDLLLEVPVAAKTGFTSVFENLGEISNKGAELNISSTNIARDDFSWTTSLNVARNVNRIEKLPIPINQHSRDWIRMEEGGSVYAFWVYKQLYVDPQTGDAVYDDVDQNGSITVADRQIVANAAPDFFGGLNNQVNYKRFDLCALFYFESGNDILNLNRFFMEHGGTRNGSITYLPGQLDRWQQPGDVTDVPRMTRTGNNYSLPSSRYIEDGSFLRLRLVTLGYTLPAEVLSKYKVSNLRLYVSGTNLWTLTNYSGLDPEVNVAGNNQNVRGIDHAVVPQPRSFQAGLNVTF
ncbi:SusC/RagA family TonB-linked outer membrane protein [Pontibacter indicus]|uniref:TonB-linked outer membrane protein, SusC/RagA family n=1 Tax=Pontibacter indicus TaxID=1317125 RepID=A0A1R3XQX7_9BACT|nr:TonB-dependent receptor [Pontibacter indicus]SIT94025.1 TonB-linked outer membrane protein, SusC/RagA family [Pontibacter indicus]